MMKAIIKQFNSPDIENIYEYSPDNTEEFSFLLQLFIGPEGQEGFESFDITVCTPKWLLNNMKKDELIFGRHYLLVKEYNMEAILKKIGTYISSLDGESWDELANKISRIGMWEFEDYQNQ